MTNDYIRGAITMGAVMIVQSIISPKISAPRNYNLEYVNPTSIEFNVADKDSDGKKESYAKINGKDYLFKMVNGEPKLVPYSLEYKIKTSMGGK